MIRYDQQEFLRRIRRRKLEWIKEIPDFVNDYFEAAYVSEVVLVKSRNIYGRAISTLRIVLSSKILETGTYVDVLHASMNCYMWYFTNIKFNKIEVLFG